MSKEAHDASPAVIIYELWDGRVKNKVTLFSSIFEIEGNKVSLFSHFKAFWTRYGYFLILSKMDSKN